MGRTAQLGWQVVDMGVEVAAGAQVSGPPFQSLEPGLNVGPSPATCAQQVSVAAAESGCVSSWLFQAQGSQLHGKGWLVCMA